MDTIFAEATPPGKGGVSIVRLSGPEAQAIARTLVARLPAPGRFAVRPVRDAGEVLDTALILTFAAGASFTGDEVVEFHLHGAPVVVRRLSEALRARGARLAGPGEFTRRAFLAGRLDLTQVEGLSDLLAAETEAQRQLAMRNAEGDLGRLAMRWRADLLEAAAVLAAAMDFPDEDTGDVPDALSGARIIAVADDIRTVLKGHAAAEIVRCGFRVAIIGPPNAGKSTLMNALARRDVAIVSDTPGTTRDLIEVHLDLAGLAVTLIDTAGLRQGAEQVEREGVSRALAAARTADLRLHLSDDGAAVPGAQVPGDIVIRGKADLHGGAGVSGKTGAGVDALVRDIGRILTERVAGAGVVSHRRQAEHLEHALAALSAASGTLAELRAEHLDRAIRHLEGLVGRIDIEERLELIFSRFCIGK